MTVVTTGVESTGLVIVLVVLGRENLNWDAAVGKDLPERGALDGEKLQKPQSQWLQKEIEKFPTFCCPKNHPKSLLNATAKDPNYLDPVWVETKG